MGVFKQVAWLLVALIALVGCSAKPTQKPSVPEAVLSDPLPVQAPPEPQRPAWVTPVTEANFDALVKEHQPNELGQVLILEYHHLGPFEERWTRRWDNFRKDLETLYAKGYRSVSLLDYLNGAMKLPAGTSPVIFTFDDSILTQFTWENGQPGAMSAVGIMLDFKKQHPDFGSAATFYVNFTPVPFREEGNWQEKIRFLVANGFEVANHTRYHEDLSSLSDAEVLEALGEQVKRLREVLPDYDGSTLALPFGASPKNPSLAVRGEWEGVSYNHRAVLLVGADPAYSPYDKRLDVTAIPRVQAIDSEFERWWPHLDRARYISDGDPETLVFPESLRPHLSEAAAARAKQIRTYASGQ